MEDEGRYWWPQSQLVPSIDRRGDLGPAARTAVVSGRRRTGARSRQPFYRSAVVAKASLLIELSRFSEASEMFSTTDPVSKFDWRMELLRALLLEAKGNKKAAEAVLVKGSRRSPFPNIRRNFKAALARHKLIKNQRSPSRSIFEPAENEISNVIWLHALAASGRTQPARKTFERILETTTEPNTTLADFSD
jgi:hypothetical protein